MHNGRPDDEKEMLCLRNDKRNRWLHDDAGQESPSHLHEELVIAKLSILISLPGTNELVFSGDLKKWHHFFHEK